MLKRSCVEKSAEKKLLVLIATVVESQGSALKWTLIVFQLKSGIIILGAKTV